MKITMRSIDENAKAILRDGEQVGIISREPRGLWRTSLLSQRSFATPSAALRLLERTLAPQPAEVASVVRTLDAAGLPEVGQTADGGAVVLDQLDELPLFDSPEELCGVLPIRDDADELARQAEALARQVDDLVRQIRQRSSATENEVNRYLSAEGAPRDLEGYAEQARAYDEFRALSAARDRLQTSGQGVR
jgi:hypothetical protein